ncbi:MAG: ATP-binding cassette domain-containing protein, partial [Pseudomonadota bacterium]
IARMSEAPDPEAVVAAAKKAGAHDMILEQPQGYDTPIGNFGGRLSGGQRQRLGLARALYGDPMILVLDEPNSNLDSVGSNALNDAIRAMKDEDKSVIIMAHRPAAIAECEMLLVLEGGMRKAFGPRDEVLKEQVKNVNQITDAIKSGAPAQAVKGAVPRRPAGQTPRAPIGQPQPLGKVQPMTTTPPSPAPTPAPNGHGNGRANGSGAGNGTANGTAEPAANATPGTDTSGTPATAVTPADQTDQKRT